ncbi:hypothetical protein HOD29_01960 [archaeon]|jgi:hypothetical protein|nr:hypothetical protein [archaeon]
MKRVIEREEIIYLKGLMRVLESRSIELKEAYEKKDSEKFNELKKTILKLQQKIGRILH